jgi:hypothetical protein
VNDLSALSSDPRDQGKGLAVQWMPAIFDDDSARSVCAMRGGSAIG